VFAVQSEKGIKVSIKGPSVLMKPQWFFTESYAKSMEEDET
jgi:hypothetical protein